MSEMNTKTLVSFVCVFVLMSSLSSGLDIKHVYKRLKSPLAIIIGLLCCYGFLPMLSFMLSLIFKLGPLQSIGLIMMSTCPGGAFASVAVYLFNADLPLSIAMTTASTILSFIFIIINSTLYIPIISHNNNININYNILLLSVSINLFSIIIGLLVSYYKYKSIQKLLGLAGLWVIILSTLYTIYNLLFGTTLNRIYHSLSFGAFISPLIVEIFSYIFGFGITYFFNLPNQQIVAIALQCGNPNVYLSIAILYITLQSNPQIDLALSMPILFTIYGTIITVILGIYLKKYKFITFKKHKKLKKLSRSLLLKFKKKKKYSKKPKILKNISSSDSNQDDINDDIDDQDPIQVFKEKCHSLFKQIPESAIQPEKILQFEHQYGLNQNTDTDTDDDDEEEDEDEEEQQEKKNNHQQQQKVHRIKGFTIDSDSDSD